MQSSSEDEYEHHETPTPEPELTISVPEERLREPIVSPNPQPWVGLRWWHAAEQQQKKHFLVRDTWQVGEDGTISGSGMQRESGSSPAGQVSDIEPSPR